MINKKDKQNELVFKVIASPIFWRMKAEELKYASEILWPHAEERLKKVTKLSDSNSEFNANSLVPDVFFISLSLMGYSIEVLFKGIIIRDNPNYVSNGKLSSKLSTHDLIKLSKFAKLTLSQYESIFCRQAYHAMMVESRYPIPKEFCDTYYSPEIGGHCKEVFTGLYNRLYPTLDRFYRAKKM